MIILRSLTMVVDQLMSGVSATIRHGGYFLFFLVFFCFIFHVIRTLFDL